MPFYDYRCPDEGCNNIQEFYERTTDDEKEHLCKACGSLMHRIITTAPAVKHKKLPKGHNLSATKRRELWGSDDPNNFRKLM
jgi:putative FmdB family regulatory protein